MPDVINAVHLFMHWERSHREKKNKKQKHREPKLHFFYDCITMQPYAMDRYNTNDHVCLTQEND